MAKTCKSTDDKLHELDALPAERAERTTRLMAALGDRHYRIVAKAAKLAASGSLYELAPALIAAYRRLLDKPAKSDPNCFAKSAMVRALVELDWQGVDFFLEALQYVQREPVWGGTVDTAVDIRASAASGLVATGYPRALADVAELLYDSEPGARTSAARAIACGNPREAELLLRGKALAGDAEPVVIGECLAGLLAVAPDESIDFVARRLGDPDEAIRELAAIALGESRHERALARLRTAWDAVLVTESFRRTLLRAAALHRSEAAFDWLLALAAEAGAGVAEDVIDALAIYRGNPRLAQRLQDRLVARGDAGVERKFAHVWAVETDEPRL